jgi:hypothetical protein
MMSSADGARIESAVNRLITVISNGISVNDPRPRRRSTA